MSFYYPAGTVLPHTMQNQQEKPVYPAGPGQVLPGGMQYNPQHSLTQMRQSPPTAATALGAPIAASMPTYVPSSATYQPGLYAAPGGGLYGSANISYGGQHGLVAHSTAPTAGNPYGLQTAGVPTRYPSAYSGHIITTSGMSNAGYPHNVVYAPPAVSMCLSNQAAAYPASAQRSPSLYPYSAGVPTLQAPMSSYQAVAPAGQHLVGPTPTYPPGHPQYGNRPLM